MQLNKQLYNITAYITALIFIIVALNKKSIANDIDFPEIKLEACPDSTRVINKLKQADSIYKYNPGQAYLVANKALSMAKNVNCYALKIIAHEQISDFQIRDNNFKEALTTKKKIKGLNDSVFSGLRQEQLVKVKELYQLEETRKEREILFLENEIKAMLISQSRKMIILASVCFIVLLISVLILAKINNDKKKANKELLNKNNLIESQHKLLVYQKEQLKEINNELMNQIKIIEKQKEEINAKNILYKEKLDELNNNKEKITESIFFAQDIQSSIMASEQNLKSIFKEFTLLHLPKNIVSGDFIWFYESHDYYYLSVADCTGHGVPGAFVSVIGMILLNKAVKEREAINSSELLYELHENMLKTFKTQESEQLQVSESIDIAVCRFDKNFNTLSFSSAKRPLMLQMSGVIKEIKGDKNSAGAMKRKKRSMFSEHDIELKKPFTCFLFTDGITDQMNYKNEKIGYSKIKEFLSNNCEDNLDNIKSIVLSMFKKHKRSEIQTDDALFTAFRVSD